MAKVLAGVESTATLARDGHIRGAAVPVEQEISFPPCASVRFARPSGRMLPFRVDFGPCGSWPRIRPVLNVEHRVVGVTTMQRIRSIGGGRSRTLQPPRGAGWKSS